MSSPSQRDHHHHHHQQQHIDSPNPKRMRSDHSLSATSASTTGNNPAGNSTASADFTKVKLSGSNSDLFALDSATINID